MTENTINEELELFVILKYSVPDRMDVDSIRAVRLNLPNIVDTVHQRRIVMATRSNLFLYSYMGLYRDILIEVLCEYETNPDTLKQELLIGKLLE